MIHKLNKKQRHRRRSMRGMCGYYKSNTFFAPIGYEEFKIPEHISLHDKKFRNELLTVIENIHNTIMSGKKRILLNFYETSKVYSQAMLLLFAEISNILNIHSKIRFRCKKPHNKKVSHVLSQIGIYSICGTHFTETQTYTDVVHWRVCRGSKVIGKLYDKLTDTNKGLEKYELYGGCIEASKNVTRHAYIEERKLSTVANDKCEWWMFTQVKDGVLTLNICDLGIGIPNTLPKQRKNLFKVLTEQMGFKKDDHASLICGAIDTPTSRSKKSYRGNGLPRMAAVVKDIDGAALEVYSQCGAVRIEKGQEYKVNFDNPIPGTIISWTLPYDGAKI